MKHLSGTNKNKYRKMKLLSMKVWYSNEFSWVKKRPIKYKK